MLPTIAAFTGFLSVAATPAMARALAGVVARADAILSCLLGGPASPEGRATPTRVLEAGAALFWGRARNAG